MSKRRLVIANWRLKQKNQIIQKKDESSKINPELLENNIIYEREYVKNAQQKK